jgi:hypothetical protein
VGLELTTSWSRGESSTTEPLVFVGCHNLLYIEGIFIEMGEMRYINWEGDKNKQTNREQTFAKLYCVSLSGKLKINQNMYYNIC